MARHSSSGCSKAKPASSSRAGTARRPVPWHFGDGETATTTEPGSQGQVLHTYRRSGSPGAYVVIEWTGTFRVGGGPVQAVTGTATTTGVPVTVGVKQARTHLVDRSS